MCTADGDPVVGLKFVTLDVLAVDSGTAFAGGVDEDDVVAAASMRACSRETVGSGRTKALSSARPMVNTPSPKRAVDENPVTLDVDGAESAHGSLWFHLNRPDGE